MKKAAVAAMIFSAAMSLSACSFNADDNKNDLVYGPPPEEWLDEQKSKTETGTEDIENETVSETEAEDGTAPLDDDTDTENESTEEADTESTDAEEAVSESGDTEEGSSEDD